MISIPEKVQDLLKTDSIRKNFRVHFPNGERADLTNNDIVLESVQFTESICSQNEIRLGLCESPVLSFDCVGVENINGVTIECSIEIDCSSLDAEWIQEHAQTSDDVDFPFYRIPYGVFVVQSCKRSTGRIGTRQVKAFNIASATDWNLTEFEKSKERSIGSNEVGKYYISFPRIIDVILQDVNKYEWEDVALRDNTAYYQTGGKVEHVLTSEGQVSPYYVRGYVRHKYVNIRTDVANDYIHLVNAIDFENIEDVAFNSALSGLNAKLEEMGLHFAEGGAERVIDSIKHNRGGYSAFYVTYSGSSGGTGTARSYAVSEMIDAKVYSDASIVPGNITIPSEVYIAIARSSSVTEYFRVDIADVVSLKRAKIGYTEDIRIGQVMNKSVGSYYYLDSLIEDKADIRKLAEASIELLGESGKFRRDGGIELFTLADSMGLTPSEFLTPSETLFPGSGSVTYKMENYKESWYDEAATKPYGRVSCTVRDDGGTETYYYVDIVDHEAEDFEESKYQTYSISDNYIIQNYSFTGEQIRSFMQAIADKIRTLQYLPADLDAVGLPNMEAGDFIEVQTANGSYQTLALKQTISGIQNLLADIVSN